MGGESTITEQLPRLLALALALGCLVTDIAHRRIYNVLTLPAAALGLVLGLVLGGWKGLFSAGFGLAAGLGLLLLPYLLGAMGAGDVKLMAALGALLGPGAIVQIFLYTSIVGGVLAIIVIIRRGSVRKTLENLYGVVLGFLTFGGKFTPRVAAEGEHDSIPYGVAIGLGTAAYLYWGAIVLI